VCEQHFFSNNQATVKDTESGIQLHNWKVGRWVLSVWFENFGKDLGLVVVSKKGLNGDDFFIGETAKARSAKNAIFYSNP
jgi:hypothetical protein